MASEIERKFLVKNDGWRSQVVISSHYRQGYLTEGGTCSIRVRIDGERAFLNIKSATLGIQRSEYEYPIPLPDAEEMLDRFSIGLLIEKTRHFVDYAGHRWEIDVFEGANAGLVVAEIELQAPDEAFELPPWAGEEVSDDPRYYNVCLAHHPYTEWQR